MINIFREMDKKKGVLSASVWKQAEQETASVSEYILSRLVLVSDNVKNADVDALGYLEMLFFRVRDDKRISPDNRSLLSILDKLEEDLDYSIDIFGERASYILDFLEADTLKHAVEKSSNERERQVLGRILRLRRLYLANEKETVKEILKPREIKNYLDRFVIGQEDAKIAISTAVYGHGKRVRHPGERFAPDVVLLIGPSGCGKTEIMRKIRELTDYPMIFTDVSSLGASQYRGRHKEDILLELFEESGRKKNLAEKGIVFMDEFDKLLLPAVSERGVNVHDDVQSQLLTMLEGSEVELKCDGQQLLPESGFVTNWRSDDPGIDGTFTYCGFAILKPEILKYVKAEGFSSIVSAYEKAMMDGRFVRAVRDDGLLWEDAGAIMRYIDLNRSGDENAFADIPQLKALGATNPRFLSARGSERVFFGCDEGIVILYDDGNRDENGKYPGHALWLKAKGIPVPEVLADIPEKKAMMLADAGVERKMSLEDYVKVVETLVRFNALGSAPDLPCNLLSPFDDETWEWERNLFAKYCLGANFQRTMPAEALDELRGVADALEREPKALVHRDFQSTNVLWKDGDLTFIDFQGMRLGPAAYDLASLVYDPYVTFTEGERRALISLYARQCGRPEIERVLPLAAVQRLSQCLGAYGRLASVGQPQFGRHVLPALVNLKDAADHAGLKAVGALADELLAIQRARQPQEHDPGCSCGHCHDHAHHDA